MLAELGDNHTISTIARTELNVRRSIPSPIPLSIALPSYTRCFATCPDRRTAPRRHRDAEIIRPFNGISGNVTRARRNP